MWTVARSLILLFIPLACFGQLSPQAKAIFQAASVPKISTGGYTPVGPTDWISYWLVDTSTNGGNGTLVNGWYDTAASANHFDFVSSGAVRAYWTNNGTIINGKGFLHFSGSSQYRSGFSPYSQTNTYFFVQRLNASGLHQVFSSTNTSDTGQKWYYNTQDSVVDGSGPSATVCTILPNTWTIYSIMFTPGTAGGMGWTNGNVWWGPSGISLGPGTLQGMNYGASASGGFLLANDDCAFVGFFNRALSNTERTNVFTDLDFLFHVY